VISADGSKERERKLEERSRNESERTSILV